ncbi:MFS transporter [Melghirimyces algeriensis]|nr:MFS transporter [Melghirimyces algeriensis]
MSTNRPSKTILSILAFCSFLVGFDSMVTVPLLPEISRNTDMPLKLGGLLYASYAIAYAVSAPIMGAVSDRWDRKKMLCLGLLVFSIATALVGFSKTFVTLILFRVLSGIGAGMIEPSVYSIVGDSYSYEQRGKAMGIVTAALISSAVIGVPLAGYIAELGSWSWSFWVIAILSFITFFLAKKILPSYSAKTESKETFQSLSKQFHFVLSNSAVFLSLLASLLYFGGLQGMFVLIGVYYYTFFDLTAGQTGMILMIAGIGSVVGSILGGEASDRWSKKTVFVLASLLVSVSVLSLSLFTQILWLAITIHILWATFFGVGQSAFTALISELNPDARGTVVSLNSSAMYIGSSLLSTIAAILLTQNGFFEIGMMCAAATISVIFITIVGVREVQAKSSQT